MENRAAVFTTNPQAVEVYQAGAWWSGELLGWRHAPDGTCQVWVRVGLGGVEETAWTDLSTLRLPERHLAMAPGPASGSAAERELSVARHPSSRREHRADADASATSSMPMVRDLSVVPDATAALSGGRRRAPEVPDAASRGGRRRAPEESLGVSGGRRRAPEEPAPAGSGGRRRAPEGVAASTSPAALGRHRAPASPGGPGRHRTADTGLFPVVVDDAPALTDTRRSVGSATSGRGRPVPSVRPAPAEEVRGASSVSGWSAPSDLDPEMLTRPMRLSDHVPHAGRPRLDSSLRGV
jgi:hypothetical protein